MTDAEIERALKQLKSRKVPGIDNISPEAFRAGGKLMQFMYLKLVSTVVKTGKISSDWDMLITPIHKNDKLNPDNYRAISLLSIPGKLFNKPILNKSNNEIDLKLMQTNLV